MADNAHPQPRGRIWHHGPWQIPYKATDVLCSDGRYRTARTAGQADTFFSLPARVSVRGKTVSGFLHHNSAGVLRFTAYSYRRNGHLLPEPTEEWR